MFRKLLDCCKLFSLYIFACILMNCGIEVSCDNITLSVVISYQNVFHLATKHRICL